MSGEVWSCGPNGLCNCFMRLHAGHGTTSLGGFNARPQRQERSVIRPVQGRSQQRLAIDVGNVTAANFRDFQPVLRIEVHGWVSRE